MANTATSTRCDLTRGSRRDLDEMGRQIVRAPGRVRIYTDGPREAFAYRAEDRDVVTSSQLDLQDREAHHGGVRRPTRHELGLVDPDRERRRRRLRRREAEKVAQRHPRGERRAVVRQDVDRAARRTAMGETLVEARSERSDVLGVFRQQRKRITDVALDRLGGFAEERIGHAFSARDALPLLELDEHDLLRCVLCPRYLEGNSEMELDRADGGVHAGTAPRIASARRSAPATPSRIGSAVGSLVAWVAPPISERACSGLMPIVLRAIATTRARGYPGGRRHSAASS